MYAGRRIMMQQARAKLLQVTFFLCFLTLLIICAFTGASVDEMPISAALKRVSLVDSAPQDSRRIKLTSVEDTGNISW